eukprot:15462408-Alexandrium_andersonii.AAC.1
MLHDVAATRLAANLVFSCCGMVAAIPTCVALECQLHALGRSAVAWATVSWPIQRGIHARFGIR